ncbi:MAG: DUF1778 domain-containing protein [Gemmatimonadota bacterium]|jgi:uncharacterized protein (DUF1778 family)
MGNRTSQLQIRITPAEKATLKRLAAAAGDTVSGYVLSKVLPSAGVELTGLMRLLGEQNVDANAVLEDLAGVLEDVPADELADVVPPPEPDAVPPVLRNRLAALVEAQATRRGGAVPDWTRTVRPLARPHFAWSLTSLKPHQMRVTPAAFKRRNLFFDPAEARAPALAPLHMESPTAGSPPEHPPRELALFAALGAEISTTPVEVEFYFLSGALLFQAFSADPSTVHISAQFQPAAPVEAAIRAVAQAHGVDDNWPHESAQALLSGPPGGAPLPFVELPRVRLFQPRPAYLLAVKCGAMTLGEDFRETEDVRFVLRAMNVTTPELAVSLVDAYLAERQLAPDTLTRLESILPS